MSNRSTSTRPPAYPGGSLHASQPGADGTRPPGARSDGRPRSRCRAFSFCPGGAYRPARRARRRSRTRTKPRLLRVFQKLGMLALARADHRREHLQPLPLRIRHHLIDHLVDGLLAGSRGRIWGSEARRRAHRAGAGSRGSPSRCPRWSGDFCAVVFWSMEMAGDRPSMESTSGFSICPKNMPGIGGEALHIAALSLGVDGVEGQARFCPTRSGP